MVAFFQSCPPAPSEVEVAPFWWGGGRGWGWFCRFGGGLWVGLWVISFCCWSSFSAPVQPPLSLPHCNGGDFSYKTRSFIRGKHGGDERPILSPIPRDESPFPNALGKGRGWGWLCRCGGGLWVGSWVSLRATLSNRRDLPKYLLRRRRMRA